MSDDSTNFAGISQQTFVEDFLLAGDWRGSSLAEVLILASH